MEELEEIFDKRKKAKEEKNLYALAECSLQMSEKYNFDYIRQEAAYFLGRLKDPEGFAEMIQNARKRSLDYDGKHRTFDIEVRYFNIGLAYPNLGEEDLRFLEEKNMCSGNFEMIDRMLFDKEKLPRNLKHFDSSLLSIKNEEFSDEFLDKIFHATYKNEIEYNIDEAIDNRYNSQIQNETWRRVLNCQYDPQNEPILVYNRRTNQIEVDRSSLDDIMLFPIHDLGKIGNLVDKFKEFFGDEVKEFILKDILPSCGMIYVYGWEDMIFPCIWYRRINSEVIKRFGIPADDICLKQFRRDIARQWLNEVNSKPLN